MTACFADTFYFIALLNSDDEAHVRASAFSRVPREVITTAWVLTELADGLAETPSRVYFAEFLNRLRSNPKVMILPPTEEQFNLAVKLYDGRRDKEWSLTDCISFVVMQDRNLTEALTGDHHFEQAGFVALLK